MVDNNELLDWDDELDFTGSENKASFILLDDGDYKFKVDGYERAEVTNKEGNIKKVARMKYSVNVKDGTAYIYDDLFMTKKASWKIENMFISVGLAKAGEKQHMPWAKVTGAEGWAHIAQESYIAKSGETKQKNVIARYLDKAPDFAEIKGEDDGLPF